MSFFGLLIVAAVAQVDGSFHHWVAVHHLGRLPLSIVWFGAIGGSLASLTGIFCHNKVDWDDSYDLWHELRPWTGLIMGSIGAFLVLVSTELATAGSTSGVPTAFNPDIYYAAAFFAGFAEQPFRALVERLTNSIFGPGQSSSGTNSPT
jgi:H+/Cl- antiporter ClcA